MSEQMYFLRKSSMYYLPGETGYTESKLLAGTYSESEAQLIVAGCSGEVEATPVTECISNTDEIDAAIVRLLQISKAIKKKQERDAGSYSVTFSIDGWRSNLSREIGELRDSIKSAIEDDLHISDIADDLECGINEIICSSNSFNCVSIGFVEGFSPMGEVELELLDVTSN
jgi:hypothetical protein